MRRNPQEQRQECLRQEKTAQVVRIASEDDPAVRKPESTASQDGCATWTSTCLGENGGFEDLEAAFGGGD